MANGALSFFKIPRSGYYVGVRLPLVLPIIDDFFSLIFCFSLVLVHVSSAVVAQHVTAFTPKRSNARYGLKHGCTHSKRPFYPLFTRVSTAMIC